MKKLGLFLMVSATAAAALIPARGVGQTFPGPDGLIAYSVNLPAGRAICAANPNSEGTPFRLTDPEQKAREPAWSPGGDELLFTGGSTSDPRIFRMPSHGFGAGATEITSGQSPTWSPDGTKIAFVRAGAIYTANIDGSNEQMVVDRGYNPAWSPDGTQIAFDDELRDQIYDNGGIYLVPAAGGTIRHLSGGFEPSWSPDGSEIAARNSFFANAIVAIDVATGQTRTIRSSEHHLHSYPAWSPEGDEVAFVIDSHEGVDEDDIDVVTSDGLHETGSIHTPPQAAHLDWQPTVNPVTPSTGRAIPCVKYPYERSVGLWFDGHLVARGRVRSLDPQVSCDQFVPVQIRKKTSSGERVFYARSRRSGRYKIRLPDRTGRYYAYIAPDDRTECAAAQSPTRSHRH